MLTAAKGLAVLAGVIHVLFFFMEAVLFGASEEVQRSFRTDTPEKVELLLPFLLNQGFYNLFLAASCLVGVALWSRREAEARVLVIYGCLFMVGAGIVLVASVPELLGGAVVQAGPPLAALICLKLACKGEAGS